MSTEQPDPIPAEGAPHAYVAVMRTHSPNADRPEWDATTTWVIPAHETDELDNFRKNGFALIPIGPDGDTGTRAIAETRKVATPAALDALPDGAVVMDQDGDAWQRDRYGNWRFAENNGCRVADAKQLFNLYQPITVLWPTEVSS